VYFGRSPSRDVAVEISLNIVGVANRKIEQVSDCGMMHYSSESVSLQVRETSVAGCIVSNTRERRWRNSRIRLEK